MPEDPSAAPGWYPDPEQKHTHGYWNGTAWTDQTRKTILDRFAATAHGLVSPGWVSRYPRDIPFPVNPVGTGIVLLGCLSIVVSLFLAYVSTSATFLGGIKDNTLIQSGGSIGIRYLITAVVIAVLAGRAQMSSRRTWGPIIGGVVMLIFVAVDASHHQNFELVSHNLSGEIVGGRIEGSPGLAFSAAGVGGLLAIIGGRIMRSYPTPQRVADAGSGGDADSAAADSELVKLRNSGILTENEFQAAEARLLVGGLGAQLEKLVKLKDSGVLTEAEFQASKSRLLGS